MNLARPTHSHGARRDTLRHQFEAADPAVSAWVSANAGSGKTHVLSMRVLRLLLAGSEPARILALTFTKAAAAEMAKRVFQSLGAWVTAGEAELSSGLAVLLGRQATDAEKERARRLFALAIETPGGLKVQTIHAFCERLLQRFPLEAGVPPRFAILDERQRRALLTEAVDDILGLATEDPTTPLARALQVAIAYAADDSFDALLAEALRDGGWLQQVAAHCAAGLAAAEADYRRLIGIAPGERQACVEGELAGLLSDGELARLGEALRAGTTGARIAALQRLLFTERGEPRKALMTRALGADHPQAEARLARAQADFARLNERRQQAQLLEATLALVRLSAAILQRYTAAKARRAALDFDDLVARAAALLSSSAAVDWVLYKLDGGLDHILLDEAQDTSPQQWRIIQSLAAEFFSGLGAPRNPRTLFAVGDEKQSIYGFQGAAPAMFAHMGAAFAQAAALARAEFRRVPLNLSFRAVAPLLEAVDRVFACPAPARGVTGERAALKHFAHRMGEAGLIEVWPLERQEKSPPAEPWSPLAEANASPPVARLAARIAATIAGWLQSREMLESENRPVRAGDILILVRKRAPFAAAMISALKVRGISVAGSDRLLLTQQIAVQDLLALGDVLLLPEDDLALATVLKSPLFGLDDDDLIALAPGRGGSLWQELQARAPSAPRWQAAATALGDWRARAHAMAPFEFYSWLLDGVGMRAPLLQRLGLEAGEAIDEFLSLALAYERGAPPSLQGLLGAMREDLHEIKRDMEQGRDEVRVMTVHGAKGLEAPIVFLPDTCSTRSGRRPGSLVRVAARTGPGGAAPFLWPVKGTGSLDIIAQARAAIAAGEAEERNRLLYVALTRARDRLYVAGFEGGTPPPADCWYNVICNALRDTLEARVTADGRTILGKRVAQTAPLKSHPAAAAATAPAPLPPWALRPPPPPPVLALPLAPARLAPLGGGTPVVAPSDAAARAAAILPPAALAEQHRLLRGTLTHALLEQLPGLPPRRWEAVATAFIASHGARLGRRTRHALVAETLAVLRDPALGALFSAEARAEVGIAAEIARPAGPPLRISGKIDRLVRCGDALLIVDYKTNRPPPRDPAAVPEAYLLQLAAYRLAARQVFAGLHIRAAILWTDGPRIMEIPGSLLDATELRLLAYGGASLDA